MLTEVAERAKTAAPTTPTPTTIGTGDKPPSPPPPPPSSAQRAPTARSVVSSVLAAPSAETINMDRDAGGAATATSTEVVKKPRVSITDAAWSAMMDEPTAEASRRTALFASPVFIGSAELADPEDRSRLMAFMSYADGVLMGGVHWFVMQLILHCEPALEVECETKCSRNSAQFHLNLARWPSPKAPLVDPATKRLAPYAEETLLLIDLLVNKSLFRPLLHIGAMPGDVCPLQRVVRNHNRILDRNTRADADRAAAALQKRVAELERTVEALRRDATGCVRIEQVTVASASPAGTHPRPYALMVDPGSSFDIGPHATACATGATYLRLSRADGMAA
jgi:hypothetical protein